MPDVVLSQQEVESLLTAIEPVGPKPATSPANGSQSVTQNRAREIVAPRDFKRLGKDQMRALQSLHDGFSHNFGAALSDMLRTIVEVELTSVDQLTYREFVFSLENPTCFNVLRADPLESNLILDINPSILYPIIDRLLGGGKEEAQLPRRPLTEIELRLVSRINAIFLREMKQSWQNVADLDLAVDRVESNPRLAQVVPPNEVVVLIRFKITLGGIRGMINLCIPLTNIERISSKLTSNRWVAYNRGSGTLETRGLVERQVSSSEVELVVTLADSRITTADLISLRVGDVITTDKDIHAPLHVAVDGITKFHARPGAFQGRKAIQVDGVVPTPPMSPAAP